MEREKRKEARGGMRGIQECGVRDGKSHGYKLRRRWGRNLAAVLWVGKSNPRPVAGNGYSIRQD